MSIFFYYNGKLYKEDVFIINANSRGLKYGDGLFETMKMIEGKIIFSKDHFERLFQGMKILQFDIPGYFTANYLNEKILSLAEKNNHLKSARIRLMVFRGDGDIYNFRNTPECVIQTWNIPLAPGLNNDGLIIDVYPHARKSCDQLANIKTNNYLPYVMAAIYTEKNNINDSVLLNTYERLCDTTIANIFIIKNGNIYTPPLSEGCIAGIIRKQLLQRSEYTIAEKPLTVEELENADEVFLTNSTYDLRWVKQFRRREYKNTLTQIIYNSFVKTI